MKVYMIEHWWVCGFPHLCDRIVVSLCLCVCVGWGDRVFVRLGCLGVRLCVFLRCCFCVYRAWVTSGDCAQVNLGSCCSSSAQCRLHVTLLCLLCCFWVCWFGLSAGSYSGCLAPLLVVCSLDCLFVCVSLDNLCARLIVWLSSASLLVSSCCLSEYIRCYISICEYI